LSISFNGPHARDNEPREYPPDARDEKLYDDVQMPAPPLATEDAYRRLPKFVQDSEGRKRWQRRFDTPERAQSIIRDYYRLITGVDREVGRIVAELDRAKLADNTIIIFTSDNGYALGDRGLADKWYMYEEDIRIPLVIYDPRQSGDLRGLKIEPMALNVDFAPTLLDYAHASIPASMQGHSLLPILDGGPTPLGWQQTFFYEHHFTGAAAIPAVEGVRTQNWSYMRWTDEKPMVEELYDLRHDPLEQKNLVGDPAASKLLETLRQRWSAMREQAK
jgi:arylsulfatase A-like enzyme